MSKKIHTNPLLQRKIEQLWKNPYVKKMTANTVMFTDEFKQLVYRKKFEGVSISETMRSCKIDPGILGESRISGFTYTLNKKAKTKASFTDQRSGNYHRPPKTDSETVAKYLEANTMRR